MDLEELFENATGAIILDGFDEAIIGLVEEFGNGPRILYSRDNPLQTITNTGRSGEDTERPPPQKRLKMVIFMTPSYSPLFLMYFLSL